MNLFNFLNQNYYILVPTLWVIGFALKNTPKIPDWSIIWILLTFSITISACTFGFTFDTLVNGVLAAGIAVFGHQILKQTLTPLNRIKK